MFLIFTSSGHGNRFSYSGRTYFKIAEDIEMVCVGVNNGRSRVRK